MVGQSLEVTDDRGDTRLREIRTIGEIVVGGVLVGGPRNRVRIGDFVRGRRNGIAAESLQKAASPVPNMK